MKQKALFDINYHIQNRRLETLIENRTVYTIDNAELNIYETSKAIEKVELQFNNPILASMIRGKKIMHLANMPSFEFLPNESVVLPSHEKMKIDFPEAREDNPTQCLALALSQEKIIHLTDSLNETSPLVDSPDGWKFTNENYYFMNDAGINSLLAHLIFILTEKNTAKDLFANLALQELTIRLMQTKARNVLLNNFQNYMSSNRMAFVVKYIHENLHTNISIKKLSDKACMSESNFFKCFKQQFGITPIEFINQQRIEKAKKMLKSTNINIEEVCLSCGYNNLNHFINIFRKYTHTTPAQYRKTFLETIKKDNLGGIPLSYVLNTDAF
jgi:AraC family transcriptional regulator